MEANMMMRKWAVRSGQSAHPALKTVAVNVAHGHDRFAVYTMPHPQGRVVRNQTLLHGAPLAVTVTYFPLKGRCGPLPAAFPRLAHGQWEPHPPWTAVLVSVNGPAQGSQPTRPGLWAALVASFSRPQRPKVPEQAPDLHMPEAHSLPCPNRSLLKQMTHQSPPRPSTEDGFPDDEASAWALRPCP